MRGFFHTVFAIMTDKRPMNDNITIQFIDHAPTDEIAELYYEAQWLSPDDDTSFIPQMIRGSFCFAVALLDNKIIGMGRALSDGCSDAYIQDVVVSKKHRGKGIGHQLVTSLSTYLEESGVDWIGLIARPATDNFYKALGFSTMEEFTPMKYTNG